MIEQKQKSTQVIKNIHKIFEVAKSTFYGWLNDYKNGTLFVNKRRKPKTGLITEEIKNFVIELVKDKKTIIASEITENIKRVFKVEINRYTIYRLLKRLNFTNKKVYIKNQPLSKEKFFKLKKEFISKMKKVNKNKLISIDESAFYQNLSPSYGWSEKGEKCVICKDNNLTKTRYSLLLAISKNKIINKFMCKGSINKFIFLDFIKTIISKYGNKYTILIDNASIHRSKIFNEYVKLNKINVIYNIPYNPETNPIEYVFGWTKTYFRKNKNSNFKEIESTIENYLNKIKISWLTKTFKKAFDFSKTLVYKIKHTPSKFHLLFD